MTQALHRCQETRRLLEQGAHLVDVRSAQEFAAGALKNAVNLPLNLIHQAQDMLTEEKPVVVYCASGARSAMAKQWLENAGFAQVHDLGGFNNIQHC